MSDFKDFFKRFAKQAIDSIRKSPEAKKYELDYISPSGGYCNYAIFKLKGKNSKTNRIVTKTYCVKYEQDAINKAKSDGILEPYEINIEPMKEPTEAQIQFANSVGIKIPDGACSEDVSRLLDNITDPCELASNQQLAECADKLGCCFSLYSNPKHLIYSITNLKDNVNVSAFYAYVFLKKKKNQPIANMFTDSDCSKCFDYANYICNDDKVMKSIRTCLLIAPNISKGTIAYNSVKSFMK